MPSQLMEKSINPGIFSMEGLFMKPSYRLKGLYWRSKHVTYHVSSLSLIVQMLQPWLKLYAKLIEYGMIISYFCKVLTEVSPRSLPPYQCLDERHTDRQLDGCSSLCTYIYGLPLESHHLCQKSFDDKVRATDKMVWTDRWIDVWSLFLQIYSWKSHFVLNLSEIPSVMYSSRSCSELQGKCDIQFRQSN